jgi:hypothetical protein
MSYSQFKSLASVKEAFGLTTKEGGRFLPNIPSIDPSPTLSNFLEYGLPVAVATGSEKARSELIITPVLMEVRQILKQQISFFSGEEFTVDESLGLNGICDFLLSRSIEQVDIEAPVFVLVEAKKGDLKAGLGQCVAEMVAAQQFNQKPGWLRIKQNSTILAISSPPKPAIAPSFNLILHLTDRFLKSIANMQNSDRRH